MDRYLVTAETDPATGAYKPDPDWYIEREEEDLHGRASIGLVLFSRALGEDDKAILKTIQKVYRLQELIGAPSKVTLYTRGDVTTGASLDWWSGMHNKFGDYSGHEINAISHACRLTEDADDCLDRLIKLYEQHPGHEELEGMCADGKKRTTVRMA